MANTAPTRDTRDDRRDDRFRELDVLKSADGMVGVISQRINSGVITFMVGREFPHVSTGEMQKTSFVPEHMVDAFIAMAQLCKQRIAEIRKQNPAPAAGRARRG